MVSRIYEREIQSWWDNHLDQFISQQPDQWQQREKTIKDQVLFFESASDLYKIFWGKFLEELYNWLRRLQVKTLQGGQRKVCRKWTHVNLVALHQLDTDLTRAVDFWVQSTLEGYIMEFAAQCQQSFSKVEDIFRSGLRGELLKEIPLWIKALMVDEGLIEFHKYEMET